MQFPKGKATDMTEAIMAVIRTQLPSLPTADYNAIYSRTREILAKEFGEETSDADYRARQMQSRMGAGQFYKDEPAVKKPDWLKNLEKPK